MRLEKKFTRILGVFDDLQIGQILQYLALIYYEEPPVAVQEILGQITENTMPQVVQMILGAKSMGLNSMFPGIVVDDKARELYARSACFGTLGEVATMVSERRTSVELERHREFSA